MPFTTYVKYLTTELTVEDDACIVMRVSICSL